MKLSLVHLWFFILGLLMVKVAVCQPFPNLRFHHLTIKDGLSTHATKHVFEDRNGIIWIATSQGLNRYDGTGIKVYKHIEGDSNSICSNYIKYIAEDEERQLWLGTGEGLSRFNPRSGKAVNYLHDSTNNNSLAGNDKCIPFIDSKKRLWLATNKGIQLFDYKNNEFITYQTAVEKHKTYPYTPNTFNQIREDATHRLWALSPYGLYLIDEKNKRLHLYSQQSGFEVMGFFPSRSGIIYVGSLGGGLAQFNPADGSYTSLVKNLFGLTEAEVYDVQQWQDNANNSWLCLAANGGFVLVQPATGSVKEYTHNSDNPNSLHAFVVYSITKDRQNRLWLATDNGVAIIDPNLQNFENLQLYQQLQLNNPKDFGLPNNILLTDNRIYITSFYNKGVYVLDKSWQLLQHRKAIGPTIIDKPNSSINSIYNDDKGAFWYSTDMGLVKQNNTGYKVYTPLDTSGGKRVNAIVSKLYKRKDGMYWIRARGNGIFLFNPGTGQFLKQYKPDGITIDGAVFSCLLDKQDVLWLGCVNGVSRYNVAKDAFEKILVKKEDDKVRPATWVTDITEDKYGTVWAATNNGLVKINPKTLQGQLIDLADGLPENNLKRILADTLGYLWIPSQQGIIRYDGKRQFTYFNINNGLPYQYEGYGFFEKDDNHNFILGFSGVVTRFNPYRVKINTAVPNIVLLEMVADGVVLTLDGRGSEKSVQIQPGKKIINIHFAITNYTIPTANRYFYKLGESDSDWEEVKNGNIALGSLPQGTYTLAVKGCNNDGVWSREEQLTMVVKPYWYQSAIFRLMVLLLLIALVAIFVRRRIAVIRKESSFKQKIAETEMQLMRSQMSPHFIFNCLNSIKLLAAENNVDAATDYLDRFARLIRLVLENSNSAQITIAQELETLRLYLQMEMIRFKEKLQYELNVADAVDTEYMEILPMLIQPYVENAIWHGLMQKEEGGKLWVNIDYKAPNNFLLVTVKDNGIGRARAAEIKSKSAMNNKAFGTKISEERIALLNELYKTDGSVTITDLVDKEGKPTGTQVFLKIPLA